MIHDRRVIGSDLLSYVWCTPVLTRTLGSQDVQINFSFRSSIKYVCASINRILFKGILKIFNSFLDIGDLSPKGANYSLIYGFVVPIGFFFCFFKFKEINRFYLREWCSTCSDCLGTRELIRGLFQMCAAFLLIGVLWMRIQMRFLFAGEFNWWDLVV